MRPIQVASLLAVLAALAGLVWWLATMDPGASRVAGPAPFGDVTLAAERAAGEADAARTMQGPGAVGETLEPGRRSAAVEQAQDVEAPAPLGARLSGRVVDAFGNPVAGARVFAGRGGRGAALAIDELDPELYPWVRRVEARTDAAGRFTLERAPEGGSSIAVRASGFAPLRTERRLDEARARELGDLVLEASVVLEGRVLDRSGRPVAGVELVPLSNLPTPFAGSDPQAEGRAALATTDESGAFRIDELAAGPFRLRVAHPEHPEQLLQGTTDAPGERRAGLLVTLEDGALIDGRVVGSLEDRPGELVVRAQLAAGRAGSFDPFAPSRSAPVGPDGAFVLRGLAAAAEYELRVLEREARRPFGAELSDLVVARAGERGLRLALRTPLVVEGQVVDAASGDPIERFAVEAGYPWPSALGGVGGERLHPEGRFRYSGVQTFAGSDRVSVRVRAEGRAPLELNELELPASRVLDLGVLRMAVAPELAVRVLSAASGEPLKGARVWLELEEAGGARSFRALRPRGEADSSLTDEQGLARVQCRPGARGRLLVRHPDHADHESESFELPAVSGSERVVRLVRGGEVVVLVLSEGDEPVEGAAVLHQALDASAEGNLERALAGTRRSGADGRIRFDRLPAGRHAFRASDTADLGASFARARGGELGPGWELVQVGEGTSTELVLHRAPRGSLRGRVSEEQRPLPGASLTLVRAGAPGAVPLPGLGASSARTDGSGRYRFDEIELGDYELVLTHPDRAMPASFQVQLRGRDQELDLALPSASVVGRVLDEEGSPLAGATVWITAVAGRGSSALSLGGFGGLPASAREGAAKTDAQGAFALRGVATGTALVVEARRDDRCPARCAPFELAPEERSRSVELRLELCGRIAVEVVRADGSPASFCLLAARYEGEGAGAVQDRREFVPEGGRIELTGLRPGPWSLSASVMSIGPATERAPRAEGLRVEVVAGELREARLRLP